MRFWDYLRYRRRMLLAAAVCCVIFAASFALYRLPLRAVLYPVGLCLLVGLGFAVWDYRRTLKRHRALTGCGDLTAELLRELPPPESLAEEDYRAQLLHLRQLCTELQSAADNRYRDAIEYYTTWAHQIKTPIASMRLALQGEDTALFRRLLSDLSRTEQYVEMVMAFLRLEDAPGDYVFREVALDEVLRQALRRFSAEFIDRRLRLDYTPTGLTVLTDEKWLCFVLEQLLSNALKYTREGSITVELAGERVLAIRDTGIGIAPEDLPRIFEKGYTGQNGRADKRASGLGLYLCSRICRNLGVGLTVKSTSGVGTTCCWILRSTPCGWNERDKPRGGESGPQGRPPQAAVGRRSRPNPPRRGGLPCGPKPALCRELAEESVGCRKPYKNVRFGAGNVSHIDGKAGPAPVTIAAVRPGPIHRWDRAPMQGGCLVYEYLGSKGSAQGLHHPLWREPGGGAAQCQF